MIVIVIAVVAGVGIGIQSAVAGPAGGLGVTVQADNPSAATVTLTNNTGASCQVVTAGLGAIVLTDVRQGGEEIAPIPLSVSFDDAIDAMLRTRSRTLENGRSVTIRLPIVPAGPTGHGLESVTWSSSGVAIGS